MPSTVNEVACFNATIQSSRVPGWKLNTTEEGEVEVKHGTGAEVEFAVGR